MTEKIPILVGITGKRALAGQEAVVRERLAQTFALIDKELPQAPKVLLSGLAAGVDTLAAQLAARRENWLVAAILPLPLPLYLEDFDEPGKARLNALLNHPKVKLRGLAPLLDPGTGLPHTEDDLHRRPAETRCGPGITNSSAYGWRAVLPRNETAGKLGGTARVVDFRMTGSADAEARQILSSSREICPPPILDPPPGAPVWRIDLPQPGEPAGAAHEPFMIHLPGRDDRPRSFHARLDASLGDARRIDELARRTGADDRRFKWPKAGSDPVTTLGQIRRTISDVSILEKTRVVRYWRRPGWCGRSGFWRCCSAPPFLPSRASPSLPHIPGRRWFLIWPLSALPLACTGWSAGGDGSTSPRTTAALPRCCGFSAPGGAPGSPGPNVGPSDIFFAAAGGSFSWLRRFARTITDWALLREHPTPPVEDWYQVYSPDNLRSWVREQIGYFKRRLDRLHGLLLHVDLASWLLFFAAQVLALWLFAYLADHAYADRFRGWFEAAVGIGIGFAFVPIVGLLWIARYWLHRRFGPHKGWTLLFGLPIGLFLGCGLHDIAHRLAPHEPHAIGAAFVIAVLGLAAIAGAIRFVADKLAWEAEAHRYAEARELFTHAEAELAAIDQEAIGPPDKLSRKREIVLTLGQRALLENEAWLRAHRERPVERLSAADPRGDRHHGIANSLPLRVVGQASPQVIGWVSRNKDALLDFLVP